MANSACTSRSMKQANSATKIDRMLFSTELPDMSELNETKYIHNIR